MASVMFVKSQRRRQQIPGWIIERFFPSTASQTESLIHMCSVDFASGAVHQILFRLPLGLQFEYTAFKMSIIVQGKFTTWDSDPMIGFMDGAGTVWVGQRGDNGIWFSIGQYCCFVYHPD
jgi:hypothetical protein